MAVLHVMDRKTCLHVDGFDSFHVVKERNEELGIENAKQHLRAPVVQVSWHV
jgi:hypothetical protein